MSQTTYNTHEIGSSDFRVIALRDSEGREVRIAPDAGFNAFAFTVPHRGEDLEVFIGPESDEILHAGGVPFGCPILWPFQNRTRAGVYTFEGETNQLDINWKDGNAIHGLVNNRAWRVQETGADVERGAWVTASFTTTDDPEVMRQYPYAGRLTVTYALHNGALGIQATVRNEGERNLPMGFGIHPWFHAPITPSGQRADCVLTVPAEGRWELESEEQLVPTGRILPLEEGYNFKSGAPLNGHFLDDVFTRLVYEGNEHVASVRDEPSGVEIEVRASGNFREHVVYAPLDRDVVCLEPYTSTTDFVNLTARGVDAGLIVLSPGDTWQGDISITARTL